jgi:hypothetical protein
MGNTISGGCGSHRPVPPNYASIPVGRPVMTPEGAPAPHTSPTASPRPSRTPTPVSPEAQRSAPQPLPGPWHDQGMAELEKGEKEGLESRFNGMKRMSPQVRDAIQQVEHLFPANVFGDKRYPREHAVVFHDLGQPRLAAGKRTVGDEDAVRIPEDVSAPTARVMVHSHPYTGENQTFEPSIADHIAARKHPHLEHVIQAPMMGGVNTYLLYSGATPPRFYHLAPNPDNLPVPRPDSPDGRMPPLRQL